ncbi:hypothetical protein [Streptomyces caniscabiei]|uniref:hypothetical protein n=1 Tax=Streptomyces caniscabiei TaxID=2746961 RepID=UPI000765BAC6|nr:hypothetical protein [Streptomyces caniscabiei]
MENTERPDADETFAEVLAALKDEYDVKEPAIAATVGVHVSTVNTWANGKAIPRNAAVLKLGARYPKFRKRLLAAVGRRVPPPQTEDEREYALRVLDRLTEEQRRLILIQAEAVADSNRT